MGERERNQRTISLSLDSSLSHLAPRTARNISLIEGEETIPLTRLRFYQKSVFKAFPLNIKEKLFFADYI